MDKKLEGACNILLVIVIILAVLYVSDDIERFASYGYAGVFIIAMLSTATVIFPSPAWGAVIIVSIYLDPVLVGIVAGIGAAIGELTGYIAGKGARKMLKNHIKESRKIEEFVKKYGMWGIFGLSFIPNPLFDIAGLVAGGLKMKWWRFLISCAAGRILRYVFLAMVGALTLELFI